MTRRLLPLILVGAPALCLTLLPSRPSADQSLSPSTRPATAPAEPLTGEQLDFARRPISYFNGRCGSCHGNYGSYWGEGFAAQLDDERLRDVVDEMAAGPAQAPLERVALDVQVAYHRSLVDQNPFVSVYLMDGKLRGEATPGGVVTLVVDGKEQPATMEKHAWHSDVQQAAAVRVTKDGRQTQLPLEALLDRTGSATPVLYSHAASGH